MDNLAFWIFTQQQLDEINASRNAHYTQLLESKKKQLNCPNLQFDDRVLERFYLRNLIKIVRSRKSSEVNQEFFMTQKFVETTVYLFKRYYLIKHFINQQPHQIILVALYLAMKLQEMPEVSIQKLAQKMKEKKYFTQLNPEPSHFSKNQGYTQLELGFLETINFQINRLSMVRPIQSLLERIKHVSKDAVKRLQIQKQVSKLAECVYYSDLFWLVHPAKLALSIILVVSQTQKCRCDIDAIDRNGDIKSLIKQNQAEIKSLKQKLSELKAYNRSQNNQDQKYKIYRQWTKYFFQKPSLRRMNNSITSLNLN